MNGLGHFSTVDTMYISYIKAVTCERHAWPPMTGDTVMSRDGANTVGQRLFSSVAERLIRPGCLCHRL
jgi:hypothetical protein